MQIRNQNRESRIAAIDELNDSYSEDFREFVDQTTPAQYKSK